MFLNCNETFLTSFALDDLLNKLVAGVCERRPVSSREVLELMSETLESHKMKQWYYSETVRAFKTSVDALNRRGFPLQMTCPLYFRIPLEDGGVDELFPSGSQVAVTPNNYDAFEFMLKQYYIYRNNPHAEGSYYDAVRPFLPISAQRNLLNPSLSPILKFMLEHFLNPDSPWAVRSEEEWQQLGVTYAVPLAGRYFPVDPSKPAMMPVPFSEAHRYVELATETCNKLNNLLKTGAALTAFRLPEPLVPPLLPPMPASAEHGVVQRPLQPAPPTAPLLPPTPPATQSAAAVAQQLPAPMVAHSTDEFAELESIGLRRETCLSMTPAELSFWDYILRLRRTPSQIQDVSFRLEFGLGRYIDLKANGAFIPVTKHNVDQFVEAAVQKQREVHRYINDIASTATTTTSSAVTTGGAQPPPRRESALSPAPAVTSGPAVPAAMARPPSTEQEGVVPAQLRIPTKPRPRTSGVSEATPGPSGVGGGGGSAAFNETRLRPADVDSAVMRSMLGLRALYNENRLSAMELAAQNLRFCLPCVEGVYNLIQNGREIKVGLRNFGEFILRVEEEKRRVEAEERRRAEAELQARARGGIDITVLPIPEEEAPVDSDTFWTDKNILEIWTYEVTTEMLAKSGLPPEEIVQQTRLQWDTHFLRNSDDPQNVMSGPRGEILPGQLARYLELLHRRLQTIRLAILDARRCSKQPSDVESNELGEAELATAAVVDLRPASASPLYFPQHQPHPAAHPHSLSPPRPVTPPHPVAPPHPAVPQHPVPPQPTEADLNMFSPTHNTGDLLAPPQSFNH